MNIIYLAGIATILATSAASFEIPTSIHSSPLKYRSSPVSPAFFNSDRFYSKREKKIVHILKMAKDHVSSWEITDENAAEAREELNVWPLDEYNAKLLNEVHPKDWPGFTSENAPEEYDLVVIGAGAGGLVSSRQVRLSINLLNHFYTNYICSPFRKGNHPKYLTNQVS